MNWTPHICILSWSEFHKTVYLTKI